jgi:hypothetical protein
VRGALPPPRTPPHCRLSQFKEVAVDTTHNPPPTGDQPDLIPTGRFEWERVVARIEMPKPVKLVALLMAMTADPDGSRVRPGQALLAAETGDSERNVARIQKVLRQKFGLLELVSRGGGRGGTGKTAEYQLTIPTDLLERATLIGPHGPLVTRGKQLHIPVSPDIQTSPETSTAGVDNNDRPDIQTSSRSSVDDSIDRTSNGAPEGLTGHPDLIDRTPGCPTTNDQPPNYSPTPGPDPAEPPDAHGDANAVNDIPEPKKCASHGLAAGRRADGLPKCALCRRQLRGGGGRVIQLRAIPSAL